VSGPYNSAQEATRRFASARLSAHNRSADQERVLLPGYGERNAFAAGVEKGGTKSWPGSNHVRGRAVRTPITTTGMTRRTRPSRSVGARSLSAGCAAQAIGLAESSGSHRPGRPPNSAQEATRRFASARLSAPNR
jgi:hypothetical protein